MSAEGACGEPPHARRTPRPVGRDGVVFDGNAESLPGDYIYLPEKNRSVTVDVRAILEALDEIYDLDRLVLELTTGVLTATEAEADSRR